MALASCRSIAGIEDYTYVADQSTLDGSAADGAKDGTTDGGADSGACNTKPTLVFSTTDDLVDLYVQGGKLLFEIYSGANSTSSISSCDPNNCLAITNHVLADPVLFTEAVTTKRLYWSDMGDKGDAGPAKNGAIWSLDWPNSGAAKSPVNTALAYPNYLAPNTDESVIFFTDDSNNAFINVPGPATLQKCTLPTCASPTLWGSGFYATYSILVGAARVFFVAATDLPGTKLALYACSQNAPCDNPPKKLIEGQALSNEAVAESADTVYITSAEQNAILQIAPSGTISTFVPNQTTPTSLGVDNGYLYWVAVTQPQGKDSYIGELRRKKLDGTGGVESILCNLNTPSKIHFDAGFIYFADVSNTGNARVERVAKPK